MEMLGQQALDQAPLVSTALRAVAIKLGYRRFEGAFGILLAPGNQV